MIIPLSARNLIPFLNALRSKMYSLKRLAQRYSKYQGIPLFTADPF